MPTAHRPSGVCLVRRCEQMARKAWDGSQRSASSALVTPSVLALPHALAIPSTARDDCPCECRIMHQGDSWLGVTLAAVTGRVTGAWGVPMSEVKLLQGVGPRRVTWS
jgi:hypothetical protein